MARRGKGQFQFTVLELTALALSFTVTSALVFLLGVYVGREAAVEHRPADPDVARPASPAEEGVEVERIASAPVVPQAVPQAPPASPRAPSLPPEQIPEPQRQEFEKPSARDDAVAKPEPETGGQSAYTVQVMVSRSRKEAESLVEGLKRKGYGAFLKTVEDSTGRWYRVRIGRFDDLAGARSMAERCRKNLGLSDAFVLSY